MSDTITVTRAQMHERQLLAAVTGGLIVAAIFHFVWTYQDTSEILRRLPARTPSTEISTLPPLEYSGATRAAVDFVPPYVLGEICGGDAIACEIAGRVVILDPCLLDSRGDWFVMSENTQDHRRVYYSANDYTNDLCHELGHVRGWEHRDPPADEVARPRMANTTRN